MPVPNIFANATSTIPLAQLDANFATTITLGNTAIQLGNSVSTLNNMTFANVTIGTPASAFPNNYLANSNVVLGNTTVTLGSTVTSVGNLTLTNVTISSVSTAITAAQGGTGLTTLTTNNVLLGNGASAVKVVAPGNNGNVLTSDGTSWVSLAVGGATGNITIGNTTIALGGTATSVGNLTLSNVTISSGTANLTTANATNLISSNAAITGGSITGITDLAILDGGTGASTKVIAFDNLSPLTTKGDLIGYDGTDNVRLAVGTNGQVLTANSSATTGLSWAAAGGGGFPSGTLMLFQQTTAPTGWTKQTTHDNKALRVVSGSASSGGSVAFTTAFASQGVSGTVGSTTLTTAQIPSHTHTVTTASGCGGNINVQRDTASSDAPAITTSATGGGGSHNHSFSGTAINLAVQYVDLIIASKD
jgi:hypothetical protein